jgi:hypothetical protein
MMNARINQLVKSLLQKDSLEQCSLQELEQFAEQNPYFGAAQLLFTKKLQTEKSDKFDDQLQKTYLFFHNPMWVEHLLNDTGTAEIKAAPVKEQTAPSPKEEIVAATPIAKLHDEPIISTIESEPEIVTANELAESTIDEQTIQLPEEPAMQIPGLKIEPIDPTKTELTFEPFHTVDYFASQGIKFKEEGKPADKFGQQLKSFTDWLKTMKRFPATEITKNVATVAEHKVEQLAEHSIEEREVVTEAMAEVWEKQGNSVKAIDIYTKLSLLEPAKSPYFAAKIEELKKLN